MSLFSRRNEARDNYRYNIPTETRSRLLHTIRGCLEKQGGFGSQLSLDDVLTEVEDKLLQRYGTLRRPGYEAARMSEHPVIEHFFSCSDEEVMDFLQMCFETRWHCGGQPTVQAINRVLSEENIGYELTDYSETITDGGEIYGRKVQNIKTVKPHLPTVIRKDERALHSETVKPCLDALADPRFAVANGELSRAFSEYRKGEYADAITDAGSSFESVLKTICAHKKWPYDSQRDTCSKLLDSCREHGLFHPFYRPILEGTATIRNKLGDAHGKGPSPEYHATKELADHMLYMVCNNINLVIGLAKM